MKLAMILWLAHTLPQPLADPMCLATTVYLEARGQPAIGQRAIAEVVLRRRDSGRWGGSVCDVATAPGQFAMALLNPNQRLREPAAGLTALRIALETSWNWSLPARERHDVVPGANAFTPGAIDSSAGHARVIRRIGDHTFYRAGALAAR